MVVVVVEAKGAKKPSVNVGRGGDEKLELQIKFESYGSKEDGISLCQWIFVMKPQRYQREDAKVEGE